MKIVYFIKNEQLSAEDASNIASMRKSANKVSMSCGEFKKGFEVACDAVYLASDFPHIEAWAVSKGIQVMKPEPVEVEPEPEKEVKTNAETLSDAEGQEEKTEEEVKPRRGRRKGADSESH